MDPLVNIQRCNLSKRELKISPRFRTILQNQKLQSTQRFYDVHEETTFRSRDQIGQNLLAMRAWSLICIFLGLMISQQTELVPIIRRLSAASQDDQKVNYADVKTVYFEN